MYTSIPSIAAGVLRGLSDLPNNDWEIKLEIFAVSLKVTLAKKGPFTGPNVYRSFIASSVTVIHAPEYPLDYAEKGGFDRAQRLIASVERIAELKRGRVA